MFTCTVVIVFSGGIFCSSIRLRGGLLYRCYTGSSFLNILKISLWDSSIACFGDLKGYGLLLLLLLLRYLRRILGFFGSYSGLDSCICLRFSVYIRRCRGGIACSGLVVDCRISRSRFHLELLCFTALLSGQDFSSSLHIIFDFLWIRGCRSSVCILECWLDWPGCCLSDRITHTCRSRYTRAWIGSCAFWSGYGIPCLLKLMGAHSPR